MTVKLYRVVDRSGKDFSINPEHIVAVDWDSKRLVFSNDESLYLKTDWDIIKALDHMEIDHGSSNQTSRE